MDTNNEQAEREARRLLIMKRVLEVLGWLTAVALFAFASHAVFAATPAPRANVAAAQTQRGSAQDADSERRERARKTRVREDLSPGALVREARTLFVAPSEHVEKKYLEYKLGKYDELRENAELAVKREGLL